MSVPSEFAPIAAQALQRVGYHVDEEYASMHPTGPISFHLQSLTATKPTSSADGKFIHLPLDIDPMVIRSGETKLVQTGISVDI